MTCAATTTRCFSQWASARPTSSTFPRKVELENVVDAVDYIARLRQAEDLTKLSVGRRVVVIGGGMTAIDIAVQTKRLGAQSVTMVYRRGVEKMKASQFERELAQTSGVVLRTSARPVSLEGHGGVLSGVLFEDTREHENELASPGSVFRIEADMLFSAIGQRGTPEALDGAQIDVKDGRIVSVSGTISVGEGSSKSGR